MKHFYFRVLQILLWVFGTAFLSLQVKAQYTSTVLETGKYYTAVGKDNQDNIYVTAYNSTTLKYQVLKYTNGTGTPTAIYQGLAFSSSEYPWAIAVNSAGDVFIMNPDPASHWQIIKLAAGTYTSSVIQSGNYYTALAVDANDNLLTLEYNATSTSYQVVKYAAANLTGSGTVVYNGLPLASGLGTYPWGIVTDHSNNIYIIDFPNNASTGRLIKLTAPTYTATTLGSGKGYTSLAIDGQDNLYTTETAPSPANRSHIMKYTAPVSVGATGTEIFTGLTIGSLFYPWGLAVDSHGTLFAGDGAAAGNGRFLKLSPPAISVSSVTKVNSSPTNASSVQYTVTFSGSASGVSASAFTLTTTGISGSSISSVTGSGTTYTVTVNTGSGDGTLRLDVNGTGIGNTVTGLPYTSGDVYTIDKTAPTDTIKTAPPVLTNSTSATFTFVASETATFAASLDGGAYSAATSPLTLTGLAPGSHTWKVQATDNAGNVTATPASYTWVIDNTPPTITSVGVPTNGYYHLSQPLNFTVNFSKIVLVTGTPSIPVTIGSTIRQAAYVSGSSTKALLFTYTVQNGDMDMDGIAVGTAIALNSGSIKDSAGNASSLTLQSVGSTANVFVNTTIPGVTLTSASTSPLNQTFSVTATFTEKVSGLTMGDFTVTNAGISNLLTTDSITFTFNVNPTASGTVTVQLPANTVTNSGLNGNSASNILSRVYDTTPPSITSIDVPANGIYHLGDGLRFKAHFSKSVVVTGTPTLDITIGSTVRQATYQAGSASDTLGFLYIVQSGDLDMDGIALAAAIVGTIKDLAGNSGVLTLPIVNTSGVLVNTIHPTVAVSTAVTSPTNQPFTATITFSEAVTGLLTTGITATNATLSNLQTTDNITYTVLVTPGANGAVTVQVPANAAINTGLNGNSASNTLSVTYDTTPPSITSIDVPANGVYHLGDGLRFKAHFSKSVVVTGTPTLDITIGSTIRQATYQAGSASDTLGFLYIVQSGDLDMDGITLAAAIVGTIKDLAGNNGVLTLPAVSTNKVLVNTIHPTVTISTAVTSPVNQPFTATITFSEAVTGLLATGITATNATLSNLQTTDNITYTVLVTPGANGAVTVQVPANAAINAGLNGNTASNTLSVTYDTTPPSITSIDVPANGIYHLGDGLRFKAHFSKSVVVTGTPTLDITIGSTVRQATYQAGSASDTLGFLYIVQSGDLDMDGITLAAAIAGTIKDLAGNSGVLTLPAMNTTGVLINTIHPTVAVSTAITSPTNQPFTATITFSEAVTGLLTTGITATNATLSNLQTTDNITYTVLVTPGANGAVTVQVPANAAINTGLNGNTVSNTLSVTYDTTPPSITSIDVPANGVYHLGDGLRFKAHFSKSVVVTGTPTLDITIGSTIRQATYQAGSASDTLGFLYIVQSGDLDMDGITLASAIVGTIKDLAGNSGVLTLPAVNTTGVLVNTIHPTVAVSTAITSPTNQPFTATITFSEAVTGLLATGITATNATLSNLQTTDNITYTVLVTPGANGAITVQVPANAAINAGLNGNTASNTLSVTYDTTPPSITSIDVPANGIYHLGDGLRFKAHFSKSVVVTGTPTLDITIGSTIRQATYQAGSASDTLGFLYIVQSGDLDMDGITLASAIVGTIKDLAGNSGVLALPAVNTTGVLVNTIHPTVAVSTAVTSPTNQPFTATITFSEAVTGLLATGITATNAMLSNLQTTDNITYTVLVTPGANGAVTVQVPANAAINTGLNGNTASNTLSVTYDTTPPSITSIDVPANGIYHLGDGLRFKAHFSKSVVVTGTPTLDITIGSTVRQATYQAGSASDTLGFLYIVQSGDLDMDGITLAAAIAGTIKDLASNSGVLTLPAVNTTGVLVNTIHPTVAVSTAVTSPTNQPFTATITFSEAVTGLLATGITATNATLSNLQTTDNIAYTVLVTPGANGAVTVQVPANAAINTGLNGNTVSNTLSVTYDTTPPSITSIDVPANGVYHLGDGLRFKAHFSKSVVVTGTPTLDITIGSTIRQATYQAGSASDTLGFLYIVQSGDLDMDGITLAAAIVGTIKDLAGNNGVLTLPAVSTNKVLVNTIHPTVTISTAVTSPVNQPFTATITFSEAVTGLLTTGITATNATLSNLQTTDNITYTVLVTPGANGAVTVQVPANAAINTGLNGNTASNTLSVTYDTTPPSITSIDVPANGIYHLGDGLRFKAHFSKSVVVTGTPTLDITIGSTVRQATYQAGSASDTLGFLYIVQSGDLDMDGITLAAAIVGTIKDLAGNNGVLTLPAVNTNKVLVNTIQPTVTISTAVTSPVNQPFTATITFSEAVTGLLTTGITATNATLSNLQTTDNITYTVLVTPGANGAVTVQVPANAAINTGLNGNTASNTLSITYDTTPPSITSIDVPANGIYHLGDGLRFKAHFSKSVVVTGTPTLDITIGSTVRQATYQAGSASDTLGFLYIVQSGDLDMDGITLAAAIVGTIKDLAGNSGVLTLPAVNTSGVLVNTIHPTVTISTAVTSPINQPFTATITFSEAVTGLLTTGITATNATLSNLQTTDNITYTVLVTPGANGAVTVQVPANAAINTGLNGNTASNTLNLVYDHTAPVVTTVDVPANAIYHEGQTLTFTVHFSKIVNATGTPVLDIVIGTTTKPASLVSGSGSTALVFSYTVQNGDLDMDGITLATLNGTLKDIAGNSAVLTLPAVNTSGVLVNTIHPGIVISTPAVSPVIAPFTATITFSEAVTGFAIGDITTTNASLSNFQTTDNITYTVLVTPGIDGAVTLQVPAGVAMNVGNNSNTASNTLSLVYAGTAPVITAVDVPANGIYHTGQVLSFTVHFSENVIATGTPTLDVLIGTATKQATLVSGSGTNAFLFSYTVQNGDMDMDGITLGTTISGSIHNSAGKNALLTLNNVGNTSGVLVNTTQPTVVISTSTTSPVIAPFTATITFSEAVTGFAIGDITATNASLSNFQTTDNITYTVLVTPSVDGAVTLQVPAGVAVNVGNNSNTASNTLSLVYAGTAPVITAVDVPANGIYHTGQVLSFTVHFSENVIATGTPSLDVIVGAATKQATLVSGSGTNALLFSYTVQNGDMDMDGITLGTTISGTIHNSAGKNALLTLNNVGNTSGVLVNTTQPSVVISTSATSPVIAPFTTTITFSEAVTGFTVPDITATNASLSNFQTTDNITYTVLVTPSVDGAVTLQVPAGVAVNVGNNSNTASNTLSLVYAGTAPVITAVDVPANGIYHTGQILNFTVHFSENVIATGTPTLDVLIGTATKQATLVSGSGTNAFLFSYTVQNGDMDMDGITLGTAISGTIRNSAGKNALLTLNNVGNTSGVLVNTTQPSVVISTSATSPVIAPFTATINFSEAVTGFAIGDITATNASLSNFLTTDNITYTVLVTPGINGAVTLQVPAGVAVNVGNNSNTVSNTLSLVYAGTAPVITAVDVPANGIYHTGQVLSFTVHFSENVIATGTPSFDVLIGAATKQATLVSGSGTNAFLFSYTVQNGDMDMDGITLGTAISGTIRNSAGKNALLTLNNVGNTSGVLVNTTQPSVVISTSATSPVIAPFTATITFSEAVTGFAIGDITTTNASLSNFQTTDNITYTVLVTPGIDGAVTLQVPAGVAVNVGNNSNTASNTLSLVYAGTAPVITTVDVPANGIYHTGQVLSFTVHFSENVIATGTPSLDVIVGAATKQATLVSGSGTNAFLFSYTVQNGDMDMDGITLGTTISGSIHNSAGKNALLTLNNVGNTSGVLVNTTQPSVVISTSATSPVIAPFTTTITFSEAVTGFTVPDITATNASLSNFQTTDNITYTVLVTPSVDGAVTLQVPAGVAVNVGNNSNTASNTLSLVYAGTAPVITTVDVPANGIYHTGQVLSFTVHFSENLIATGTPSFDVLIGAATKQATLVSGSGTNAFIFSYTVQNGDMDMDGITLGTAISGTIRNSAGKNALLTLNNVGNTSGVLVNTAQPSVLISTSATSPVIAPFTATITFSEAVTGFAIGDITATNASLSNFQTTDNITYTVLVTPSIDGAVTLQVPAGVAVNVGNNSNTASNTLSLVYAGTAPVITAVDVPANGIYHTGQVLSFTVHFSENVIATGTPTLDVLIGAATKQATLISGSGTNALLFSYTVQNGDMDMDGITLGTAITGTIHNSAGKNALLTLNNVGNTSGVLVNTTQPGVAISTSATSPVIAPFTATITFSEAVTGFTVADITATNASLSNFQTTDNITYTVLVTPSVDGAVTLQVPAGVAVNVGNNSNTASNTLSLVYAGTAPVITAVDVPANGIYHTGQVLSFTVHFSENVIATGTPSLDVLIGAATKQATLVSGSGTNAFLFSYTVQNGDMDMDGITLGTAISGSIHNSAGKNALLTLNNVGNTSGVLVNTTHPGVVITTNDPARINTPVTITITFTEMVNGFTTTGIVATNATVSNLQTTDHIRYSAVITPLTDGAVNVSVPAGAATNAGGNDNTASNTLQFTYDATPPVITAQTLNVDFNSPAGTVVGTLTATDASGIIQNWMITADESSGAFAIDAQGNITVKDAAILSSKAGTTVRVTVTVSDGLNTSTPTAISINISKAFINQPPTLDPIPDANNCAGTAEHTIQLTGISAVEAGQTYHLTVAADQADFDVLTVDDNTGILHYQLKSSVTSGSVNVTVTIKDNGGTANGGIDTRQRSFHITIDPLPDVTISSNKGSTVSKGDILQLTATGGGNYKWATVDGIISGQQSAVLQARIMTNTTYEVTVVNAAGCSNNASINIAVVADFKVESSNILTPNGDGKNDKWVIRNIDSYPNNEVKVYDRTGRIVFQRRNYNNDWDGTVNGHPLAEGTYYYILTISGDTKTAKGYITIIRDQQ